MTKKTVNVLITESSGENSSLILETLECEEYIFSSHSITSIPELQDFLSNKEIIADLVIAAHEDTGFDIFQALKIIHNSNFYLPLIVIGDEQSEDLGLEVLEAGAQDFIDRKHLKRLLPVVKRELMNANIRSWHRKAEAKNELLNHILEKSLNEIYLLDPETLHFTYANEAMLSNLGYTEEELYQLQAPDIVDPHYKEAVMETVRPIIKGDKDKITFQLNRIRKDGSIYPAVVHVEKLAQEDQTYILGICFDLTQQKQDAKFLKRQEQEKSRLKLENKYKSEFIANLSHEMRTTINSVLLLSEILAENRTKNLNPDQIEYLTAIHAANNNLLELLNEVLDLSKIEAGKIDIKLKKVKVQALCKHLERLFKPIAREQNLLFKCEISGSVVSELKTDRLRVEQVLNNLISNALKFTAQGEIRLKMYTPDGQELKKAGLEDPDMVAIQVIDTGIGIPEDKQKIIFDNYQQAQGASTLEKYGGTGLGLAISKDITHILGGKLTLKSIPGTGSTFTLYLPTDSSKTIYKLAKQGKIRVSEISNNEPISKTIKQKPKQQIKGSVLLVDDSKIHNMALKEFLSLKIKNCITAESATEAYQIMKDHHSQIDCIVLDMYLPDANGKEVLIELKNNSDYQSIPIIVYSGKSLTSKEEKDLKQYALDIVQKNVMSYKKLLQKITSLIYEEE